MRRLTGVTNTFGLRHACKTTLNLHYSQISNFQILFSEGKLGIFPSPRASIEGEFCMGVLILLRPSTPVAKWHQLRASVSLGLTGSPQEGCGLDLEISKWLRCANDTMGSIGFPHHWLRWIPRRVDKRILYISKYTTYREKIRLTISFFKVTARGQTSFVFVCRGRAFIID